MDLSQYERFWEIDQNHWWFVARRKIVDCIITSVISPKENLQILDIGTGSGGMVPLLSKYGQLTATEPDQATFEYASGKFKEYPRVQFLHGGWESLDLPPQQFDLVTAFDVLEHCENDVLALKRWGSWLHEGGSLLLTIPAFSSLWGINDVLSHHYRRYTKETLTKALQAADFKVDKISYCNALMFGPVWISRNIKDRIDRWLAAGKEVSPWDFGMPPKPLNAVLEKSFSWETSVLPDHDLPFGTSLICVAHI